VFAHVIIVLIIWSSEPWAREMRESVQGVGVFHRDLGIKYLHDSSFTSVYTAKLANPKYSAFTSTRRRKTGGIERREGIVGGPRVECE